MCLCSFIKINAQPKSGDAIVPYGIDTDSMTVIDRGFLRVKYAFNADEIDDPKTYIDLQCLEVGNRISKYYSMLAFKRDSLQTEWRKKHPKANIPHFYSDSKRAYHWSEYQYSEIYKDKGYAMNAKVGKDGVEKAFEEYLHIVGFDVG